MSLLFLLKLGLTLLLVLFLHFLIPFLLLFLANLHLLLDGLAKPLKLSGLCPVDHYLEGLF
jgi:hypothetical protein